MEPEKHIENQEKPVAQPPPGVGPPGDNRDRRGGRRSGFRRGGRGGRGGGDRGERGQQDVRGPRNEEPRRSDDQRRTEEPRREDASHRQPSGSIGRAIEHAEHIRLELERVLEEVQEILQTLDQAEREKTASEAEIEKLRDSLRHLHREPAYSRYPRNDLPPKPSGPVESVEAPPGHPPEESQTTEEDD